MQFLRYAEPLKTHAGAAQVLLACPSPLLHIAATCPYLDVVFDDGGAVPADYDLHLPLMSAPHALGTTLANVPAPVPYMAADPQRAARTRTPTTR